MKHTPTPWKKRIWLGGVNPSAKSVFISAQEGRKVAQLTEDADGNHYERNIHAIAEAWANADLICRAVNSHDALVGAVLMLLGSADLNMGNLDDSSIEAIENARAALEAAKGEWLCKYLTLMKSLGSSESQKTGRRFLRRTKCRLAA